jgi:hypothetical protein
MGQDRRDDAVRRGDVSKILRFALSPPSEGERPARFEERDFEEAFDLVEEAGAAMRASQRRIQTLEAAVRTAVAEAEAAKEQLQAAAARAVAAEVRAEEAEMRAQDAELWLRRMHELIRRKLAGARPGEGEAERTESRVA